MKKLFKKLTGKQLFYLVLILGIIAIAFFFNPFCSSNDCREFTFYQMEDGKKIGHTTIGCPEEQLIRLNAELLKAQDEKELILRLKSSYEGIKPRPTDVINHLIDLAKSSEKKANELKGKIGQLEGFGNKSAKQQQQILSDVYSYLAPGESLPNFGIMAEKATMEHGLSVKTKKISDLMIENQTLKQKILSLRRQISSLLKRVDDLVDERDQYKNSLEAALAENARLNQKQGELNREVDALKSIIQDLKTDSISNAAQIASLEGLVESLEDENSKLDNAINKVTPVRVVRKALGNKSCKVRPRSKVYRFNCVQHNGLRLQFEVESNFPKQVTNLKSQYFKDQLLTISVNVAPYKSKGSKQQYEQKQRIKAGDLFNKKLDAIFPSLKYVKGTYDIKITYYPYVDKPIFSDIVKVQ